MLADAYYTAAGLTEDPEAQRYFISLAAAMVYEWRTAPTTRPVAVTDRLRIIMDKHLPSKNQREFNALADQVTGKITIEMVEHFGASELRELEYEQAKPVVDILLQNLHRLYIGQALDPANTPTVNGLLTDPASTQVPE